MKKRPLRTAAYCGIALLIIAIISNLITEIINHYGIQNVFLDSIFILVGWIDLLLMIFFTYGFVVLGKKYKKKLLIVMSWIIIGITIAILLTSIIGTIIKIIPTAAAADSPTINNILNEIKSNNPELVQNITPEQEKLIATAFIIVWVIMTIILGALSILFGIGILSLKEMKYARATGILNIIAGATYIIFIGFAIELAGFILGVMLLFNASKKLEK